MQVLLVFKVAGDVLFRRQGGRDSLNSLESLALIEEASEDEDLPPPPSLKTPKLQSVPGCRRALAGNARDAAGSASSSL